MLSAPARSAREVTITLPAWHAGQAQVVAEARRMSVVACGRRWGKSTLLVERGLRTVLAGQRFGWFSPSYKSLLEVWRSVADQLEPVTRRRSEQDHRLELLTGGVWECWSLDEPNAARGRAYSRVAIDEAAQVPRLSDAWSHVIRPTLTDLAGDAWFASTPQGLNDFHTLYQRGQSPDFPDWAAWTFPTSGNPYLPPEEVEAARHELPERVFAQEYLASFLESSGSVFRRVTDAATLQPQPPQVGHTYVVGVDWGRLADFSVYCVLDVTTTPPQQVALERFNQIDWQIQYTRLQALCRRYRPALIVAERNSVGDPAASALRALGLPVWDFVTTNATKAAAIQGLALALEQGDLALLDDPVQTGELLAYTAERLPSGLLRYGAPPGMHDDTCIALALAYVGAEKDPGRPRQRAYSYAGQAPPPPRGAVPRWVRGRGVNPFSGREER